MNLIENLKLELEIGNISGYKIISNLFLNENESLQPIVDTCTPFKTTKEGFTNLGIEISPDMKQLVSLNYLVT